MFLLQPWGRFKVDYLRKISEFFFFIVSFFVLYIKCRFLGVMNTFPKLEDRTELLDFQRLGKEFTKYFFEFQMPIM